MIHMDWPWALLLLPLPLLAGLYKKPNNHSSIRIPTVLEKALNNVRTQKHESVNTRSILLWLAWIALLGSLSQPWQPGNTVVQPVSGRAIAIAIDVSGSMERNDFILNGETLDRLSVVKKIATQFISKRQGDRISLVLYGKEAFIASPLTFDLASVNNVLQSAGIGMAGRSTAIGDAIGLSIQTLTSDPASQKAIILLSDGTNNAGSVEPESAASFAKTLAIRIHTIALGSEDKELSGYKLAQSADLDEATLMAIAEESSGRFYRAKSYDDLNDIYAAIDSLERVEVNAPPVILRHDLRHWPLYCLLLCLTLLSYQHRARQ